MPWVLLVLGSSLWWHLQHHGSGHLALTTFILATPIISEPVLTHGLPVTPALASARNLMVKLITECRESVSQGQRRERSPWKNPLPESQKDDSREIEAENVITALVNCFLTPHTPTEETA